MSKPTKPHVPTASDKEKMQHGAAAMRAVDAYLQFIATDKPRGRPVDMAALQERIDAESNLGRKVILVADMHRAVARVGLEQREAELQAEFVRYADWFSRAHNVNYAAWREMGCSVAVLKEAGINP